MKRKELIGRLRKDNAETAGAVLARIQNARNALRAKILASTPDSDSARSKTYAAAGSIYEKLAKELDAQILTASKKTAEKVRAVAVDEIGSAAGKKLSMKFDPERLRRITNLVTPENVDSVAAVFTKKMAAEQVEALRKAVVDVFRQGDLEAWTATRRVKELQAKWTEHAKTLTPQAFIDKSGREWPKAQYAEMLVRTTQARVHREAFLDTVVESGSDLARVAAVGDNCEVCARWADVIISVTGADKRFPTYDDAKSAGLFHPNCDCSVEYIDDAVDAKDIEKQGKAKTPKDLSNLDTLDSYRKKAGLDGADEGESKVDFAAMVAEEFKSQMKR